MRITTVEDLVEKLYEFDEDKPVVVTYQGVAFNIEEIVENSDGFIIISTGFNADIAEDK